MRGVSSRSRAPLWLVVSFLLLGAVYSCIWGYYIHLLPQGRIGVVFRPFYPDRKELDLVSVARGSPAERAGLVAGDRILAINGRPLDTAAPWIELVATANPNSRVLLTIRRASGGLTESMVITPVLPFELVHPTLSQVVIMDSLLSYPLFFLAVCAVVLFYRSEDRNAWLLAIMFSGFIARAPWVNPETELMVPLAIRRFGMIYQFTLQGLLPALFYYFFAVFPVRSPLDRRLPWLKHALIAAVVLFDLPFLWPIASTGSYAAVFAFAELLRRWFDPKAISVSYTGGCFAPGLFSLAWNSLRAPNAEVRRKTRVLALGTTAGIIPLLAMTFYVFQSGKEATPLSVPFYVWVLSVAGLMLVPLSFAYAVVVDRVMEIPVLLKRSARYLLVRRSFAIVISMASIGAAWVFVKLFFRLAPWASSTSHVTVMTVGMAGAGVGGLMAVASARVQQRVRERLDQAFFRGQCDARQILEDLAERIRAAQGTGQLATLLNEQITHAVHPSSVALYLECADGQLEATSDGIPAGSRLLSAGLPLLKEIARRGRPMDVPPASSDSFAPFLVIEPLHPECIVPFPARDGRLAGVMVLGPRLSDEPYSAEDKRLLAAVANQAGAALDAIRLAERMAQQLELERRTAYELEMARQVQSRLLPQHMPPMQALNYAGSCIQARVVGGDYYDFLDVGKGRIVFILADVSGKGMPAALLMASLQATMRSHCAAGLSDPASTMRQVNRQIFESTSQHHFATLFMAEFDDMTRHLQYINCGHNPPILLRSSGIIERLGATASVLGAFAEWECAVAEVVMETDDMLAMFTDGITEATNAAGEEFGEDRLIAALCANRGRGSSEIAGSVTHSVQEFGGRDQADDLTLIIANVLEPLRNPESFPTLDFRELTKA